MFLYSSRNIKRLPSTVISVPTPVLSRDQLLLDRDATGHVDVDVIYITDGDKIR